MATISKYEKLIYLLALVPAAVLAVGCICRAIAAADVNRTSSDENPADVCVLPELDVCDTTAFPDGTAFFIYGIKNNADE